MKKSHKSFSITILYFLLLTINGFVYSHSGTHSEKHAHLWQLTEDNHSFKADYIAFNNGIVLLQNTSTGKISQYPITDFSMEDQLLILKRHELTAHINANLAKPIIGLKTSVPLLKISKFNANIGIVLLLLTLLSFVLYFRRSNKKNVLFPSLLFISFLFFITCSKEDTTPVEIDNTPIDVVTETPSNTTTNTTSTTATSTTATTTTDTSTNTNSSTNTTTTSDPSSILSTIESHFSAFTDVSISADEDYFYISSYGWPAHDMAVGITSWQEQVPIPQNYTGDNSWAIPLNPEMSDDPLDTSLRLRKGALAVAVNGIPIFNSLNNRGNDSFVLGELDNWGGHFGRGDDYHYHKPPTHLQDVAGAGNPIAYALDGFPVYGFTDLALDDALGRYDENESYRYHTSTEAPYFIAKMMGVVTIDPTSTAPEDQIIPQAFSSPVRPSDGFGPVDGAEVTAFSQTGDNAFSFEYTVSGTKYYINYSWDPTSCDYTYTHVDENGGTSNLPTNGAIAEGSTENVETYTNRSFCIDIPYTGTTPTDDTSTVTETTNTSSDTTSLGYTVSSSNSDFSLSSIAIDANGAILESYTCEAKVNGAENSIPISWANVPEGTGSLAISIHANINADEINHYLLLWDIDPSVSEIPYGNADDGAWFMGPNKDFAKISYSSPCSPSPGTNTYIMTIYALSETPSSLPTENSLEMSYPLLLSAIETVTLIDSVQMTYISVTE